MLFTLIINNNYQNSVFDESRKLNSGADKAGITPSRQFGVIPMNPKACWWAPRSIKG